MGFRTKQVSGDQLGLDWGQTLLPSDAPELPKPPQTEPLKCPRCGSINTKFCYYNNYNKSQPRHFCKSCKRHWTKGGTLRNVPVGGSRKNKRPKISPAAKTAAATNWNPTFTFGANPAGDQKSVSNILYQALIRSPSPLLNETTGGIDMSISPGKDLMASNSTNTVDSTGLHPSPADRNPNSEFQFSSLGATFETNGSLIPSSCQATNTYELGNMDSMEESTVTIVNMDCPSSSSGGWLGFDGSNCGMGLGGNYWNWSEIEALTSADELNMSWEEDEGKMKP